MNVKAKGLSLSDRIVRAVMFVIMTLVMCSYLFMFIWLFGNSFRSSADFLQNTFKFLDFKNYTLDNWKTLFTVQIAGTKRNPVYITDTIFNTVFLVFVQVLLAVTIPAFTGYITSKYKAKICTFIINMVIISMVVPSIGSLSVNYRLMTNLKLVDTYWCVILMNAGGFGFGFLLFRNFFGAIPWEYAESAFLDGASDMQVFLKIMYPQALPILSAIAINSFISHWNDYYTAYIYLPNKPTIALGVYQLYTKMNNQLLLPVAFAGMSLLAGVSLIIFGIFNKSIMNNFSIGGVKG
ncbi:MAG: carbohydrate ABC transporter permease [Clostridia bacterium]|nr:carbohydrate ABC transporter permease [Clostridia bacterium]